MNETFNVIAVAAGGALGAVARYGLVSIGLRVSEKSIPWGIVAANFIGCLLIGFLYSIDSKTLTPVTRLAITVGFVGALTTFSTLCLDFVALNQHHSLLAVGYLVMSLVGGIGLVYVGQNFGRLFIG